MCKCHMLTLLAVMTAQHAQELLELPSQWEVTGRLAQTQALWSGDRLVTGTLLIPSNTAMRRFMVSTPFSPDPCSVFSG